MQLFPRFLILTFFALNIIADADWPKFRGPSGEGIWECPNLPLKLDQTKKIWKKEIGGGYSGITISGDKVFTMDRPSKKIKNEFYVTAPRTANLFGSTNTMQTIQG